MKKETKQDVHKTDEWLDLCAWCGSSKYVADKKFRKLIDDKMDKLDNEFKKVE